MSLNESIVEDAALVDTALRGSAFSQSEATPQVLSEAKNNMVALPGQLFYSTQILVCLWFLAKNKNADAKRMRCRRGRNPDGQLHRLRLQRETPLHFLTATYSN